MWDTWWGLEAKPKTFQLSQGVQSLKIANSGLIYTRGYLKISNLNFERHNERLLIGREILPFKKLATSSNKNSIIGFASSEKNKEIIFVIYNVCLLSQLNLRGSLSLGMKSYLCKCIILHAKQYSVVCQSNGLSQNYTSVAIA